MEGRRPNMAAEHNSAMAKIGSKCVIVTVSTLCNRALFAVIGNGISQLVQFLHNAIAYSEYGISYLVTFLPT
jgi:hypothetical protein